MGESEEKEVGAPFGLSGDSAPTPPTPTLPPSRGKGVFERTTYTPAAGARAKQLRRDMTVGERKLWEALRALKLNIRRQAPIGRYIADFVHLASRLVIEVDGSRHNLPGAQAHDAERDAWMQSQGFRILRIKDADAFGRPWDVARFVERHIKAPPLKGGGLGGGVSAGLSGRTEAGADPNSTGASE